MNDIEPVQKVPLNAKPTGGVVGTPVFNEGGDEFGKVKTADTKNTDAAEINITASTENLSAKYKNPRVKQDVESVGNNQYEYGK